MNIEVDIDPATEIRALARPTNLQSGMEPLKDLARKADSLDAKLQELADLAGESTERAVERLRNALADFEPSVTFLGQVKAGKTSLVNAMAGWADLLPSDVNPWTSVVTSLHLVPGKKRIEIGARFKFMTEEEWDRLLTKGGRIGELAGRAGADSELQKIREQIETMCEKSRKRLGRRFEMLLGQEHEYGFFDKNLVERYTVLGDDFDFERGPSDDDQGRFADITRSADLYLNSQTVPFCMCLRDTPGVNDTFMMREQVTIQAIRESKICVVVLSAHQALTAVDMGLIRLISNLKARDVLIFVNRIDELPDPANQIPEIETSIRQTLKDHHGPEAAEIVFGSAYWANKVLSGQLEEMSEFSTKTLLSWAESTLTPQVADQSSTNMVWELSGLPALFRALSGRIVETQGKRQLHKIASSAVTIAGSLHAADTIAIGGAAHHNSLSMYEVKREFDAIAERNLAALDEAFAEVVASYQQRADRAHANFVERATHSLIGHLERYGESDVWEYSPTGLRMLLRSAYTVFGTRAQSVATYHFETAVGDVAELYCRAFGPAVEGIQIAVPSVPQIPSPVALGQTIALDFRDGWWVSWWRRTRGYKAFANRFHKLISAETEDFMHQLKTVQTEAVFRDTRTALSDFFEEQKDILLELRNHSGGDVQELFIGRDEVDRQNRLQDLVTGLSELTTEDV